jgi:hypothetical protein
MEHLDQTTPRQGGPVTHGGVYVGQRMPNTERDAHTRPLDA